MKRLSLILLLISALAVCGTAAALTADEAAELALIEQTGSVVSTTLLELDGLYYWEVIIRDDGGNDRVLFLDDDTGELLTLPNVSLTVRT